MAVAFDSLRFVQRLEEVGIPHAQAERHAELARDMILADLVRDDTFRSEMSRLDDRLDLKLAAQIANAKADLVRTVIVAQLATILVVVIGIVFR